MRYPVLLLALGAALAPGIACFAAQSPRPSPKAAPAAAAKAPAAAKTPAAAKIPASAKIPLLEDGKVEIDLSLSPDDLLPQAKALLEKMFAPGAKPAARQGTAAGMASQMVASVLRNVNAVRLVEQRVQRPGNLHPGVATADYYVDDYFTPPAAKAGLRRILTVRKPENSIHLWVLPGGSNLYAVWARPVEAASGGQEALAITALSVDGRIDLTALLSFANAQMTDDGLSLSFGSSRDVEPRVEPAPPGP